MAFYGNILTIYDGDDIQMAQVKTALQNRNALFEQIDFTLFIETTSVANTR